MSIDVKVSYGRVLEAASVRLAELVRPTIVTWQRIEPLPYCEDLEPGLRAEVADPLWFLTRQWQFAEFAGEDAGSPITVPIGGEQASLSRVQLGAGARNNGNAPAAVDYAHGVIPLEALVEPEALHAHPRLAAEAGEHLLRLLAAAGLLDARQPLRAAGFALEIRDEAFVAPEAKACDPSGLAWQTVFAGRALDGAALAEAIRALRQPDATLSGLPAGFDFASGHEAAAREACARWLVWYEGQLVRPDATSGGAWIRDRMEYALSATAKTSSGTIGLRADEYTDGDLDWYAFDAVDGLDLGAPSTAADPQSYRPRPVLPTAVRYPGMPSDRFWEIEDARVSFGQLEAGPTDLGRLLLAEYALVFGTDWFVIPLELAVGSVFRLQTLEVRDTFGVTTQVGPSRNMDGTRWAMFNLSRASGSLTDLFLLPPTLAGRLEGDPLEEVALFRDEMANMVWGVEKTVQGASGEPRDRRLEPPSPAVYQRIATDQIEAELIYRLATPVPEPWHPFIPVADHPNAPNVPFSIHLERRALLRTELTGAQRAVHPQGVLLRSDPTRDVSDEPPLQLREEEVPRSGVALKRSFQYARWTDGRRLLWVGRSKRAGRGEGDSGLRYDIAPYRRR